MNITNHFNPSQGVTIISPYGSQKYPEKINSFSNVSSVVFSSPNNDKFSIDSCWETGNIYYANYDENYVKKIAFDGTELATLSVNHPLSVSVIQYDNSMPITINDPPQEDRGCWITNGVTRTVIKTDGDLNILYTTSAFTNPSCVISNVDTGCYVIDTTALTITRVSITGQILGALNFSALVPAATSFRDIKMDINGDIWFLANDRLYNLSVTSGTFTQNFVKYPVTDIGGSSPEEEHVGGIDVDRNSGVDQFIYVAGGNSLGAWVMKYDKDGVIDTSLRYANITYPYILRSVQGYGGTTLYLLSDESKWDEFDYGSSSSSSSSSL